MASSFQCAHASRATRGCTQIESSLQLPATFHKELAEGCSLIPSHTAAIITEAIGTRSEEIPRETRRVIEAQGSFDLAGIHIHVGSKATAAAKSLGARAFSVSRHIIFAEDESRPTSDTGL